MSSSTSTSDIERPRTRRLVKRTLCGAALVLYTGLIGEAYFRVFDPQPLLPRYVTGTPWGVRGNIPHARYWNHTDEVDVEYRINGQGLRADADYALAKPPGTCRVAVFGDSFFFGIELDVAQTFASQLQQRLRAAHLRVEVLNFAVGGFGTAEMLQTYTGFGQRFDPDAVIFSWDTSDESDNVRSGLFRLDDGRLETANATYLPGVKTSDWLMRHALYRLIADHSELYSFLREKIELTVKRRLWQAAKDGAGAAKVGGGTAKPGAGAASPTAAAADGDADEEEASLARKRAAMDLSAAILLRANDVIHANGADFYLVEIPFKLTRTRFQRSVAGLPAAVRDRIHIVDTTDALGAMARPDLKLFFESGQGHITPIGESVLVEQTMRQLAASPKFAACRIP